MPMLYQSCDVVVIPSTGHEGTSLSAIEGIVSGKPTVVTHIGGLPNIAIDGLNAYVCDLSPTSLAGAIRKAIENCTVRDSGQLEKLRRTFSIKHAAMQHDAG